MDLRHFSWKQRAGLEFASVFQNTHFDTIPRLSFNRLALECHLYIFCIETIQNYTPPIKKFPE